MPTAWHIPANWLIAVRTAPGCSARPPSALSGHRDIAFRFGCILFLPFGGWAGLVAAITAASSFMYSFAPVAAVSLRKSDPDRERPYRAPILNIIAPFSFVVSGFIIYWSGTSNIIKLDLAVLFFLILYMIARRIDPNQEPLDFRAGSFAIPWIIGLTLFSIFGGSYVDGLSNAASGGYATVFGIKINHHLPFWWDLAAHRRSSP